jgi:hypothetical protein
MSEIFNYDPVLVLASILKRNASHMKTPHGFVALVDPNGTAGIIEYGMGIGESYIGRHLGADDGVAGGILTTGQPQVVVKASAPYGQFRITPIDQHHSIDTIAGTPVWVDGKLVAMLVFIFEPQVLCPQTDILPWLAEVGTGTGSVLRQLEAAPHDIAISA